MQRSSLHRSKSATRYGNVKHWLLVLSWPVDDVPSTAQPAHGQRCSVLALPFPPMGQAVPTSSQSLLGRSLPLVMERQKSLLHPLSLGDGKQFAEETDAS